MTYILSNSSQFYSRLPPTFPFLISSTTSPCLDLDSDIILSNHPNIFGSKLSCGNIGKLHRLTSVKQFITLAGVSEVLVQGLLPRCHFRHAVMLSWTRCRDARHYSDLYLGAHYSRHPEQKYIHRKSASAHRNNHSGSPSINALRCPLHAGGHDPRDLSTPELPLASTRGSHRPGQLSVKLETDAFHVPY